MFGDVGLGWRIILKCILKRQDMCGLESSGSGWGPVAGSCEHGTEPSGFKKVRQMSECWLVRKNSAS
jgi:hypothetical protein